MSITETLQKEVYVLDIKYKDYLESISNAFEGHLPPSLWYFVSTIEPKQNEGAVYKMEIKDFNSVQLKSEIAEEIKNLSDHIVAQYRSNIST